MAAPPQKRATYEDLLGVPSNLVAEIIDGNLITQPRPGSPHALAMATLNSELHDPFMRGRGGPGGWIVLTEPELHLKADVLVPDLAGWRRERMPEMPRVAAFELAPDWVCEILSPSTAATDRALKMPIYAREDVRNLWLIDPAAQTLEVFRLESRRWSLLGVWRDDEVVRAEPFDVQELALADLWSIG